MYGIESNMARILMDNKTYGNKKVVKKSDKNEERKSDKDTEKKFSDTKVIELTIINN